jgi:cyclophilin family peptidyl-prolyl cis-trans isomerase
LKRTNSLSGAPGVLQFATSVKKLLMLLVCVSCGIVAARAQVSTNPNNTIVRFDFASGGTNFGSLDVELFDQDKPETVKNFLLYVYSGGYSNLLLHRLATNFVLQAGSKHIPQPNSTNEFDDYVRGEDFGRITNEYSVGPELSNLFGTIAMARVGGQTNSASADFFVNLTDNPVLDTVDGGFTVFGRVINTASPITGTNLLNALNSITNIVSLCFDFFCSDALDELPLSTFRFSYTTNSTTNDVGEIFQTVTTNQLLPQMRDLIVMNASIIRGQTPERVRPKLVIEEPSRKVRTVTNSTVTFTGTSSDNLEVARVLYSRGGGSAVVTSRGRFFIKFRLR